MKKILIILDIFSFSKYGATDSGRTSRLNWKKYWHFLVGIIKEWDSMKDEKGIRIKVFELLLYFIDSGYQMIDQVCLECIY